MKRICLIRHAKSAWDHHGLSDKDRPLNNRGLKNAPEMAERLNAFGLKNPRVMISTAERTYQTGKYVEEACNIPKTQIHHLDALYLATVPILFQLIATSDASDDLVFIGHNPGLSELASLISGETVEMVTSHVVVLELHVEDWAAVTLGTGSIVYFDYPKKHSVP